jgi:hypothetical protein
MAQSVVEGSLEKVKGGGGVAGAQISFTLTALLY